MSCYWLCFCNSSEQRVSEENVNILRITEIDPNQTELIERLRQRRGDTSEDDEGLPHSPPCNSPSATEGHLEKSHNKELPTKSHSTCSDGSLLSMGSSEMDEDSLEHSRYTSKDVPDADITEWGPINSSVPLNHSAAHHKVSIRPKRTHGAPRRKKTSAAVLPTTPEVNEDASGRSLTPEMTSKAEAFAELYTSMSYHLAHQDHAHIDPKMKCSSLPPGLAGPGGADSSPLTRSRSNAGSHGQETFAEEEEYGEGRYKETSFFGRIFPRRSGKKKKVIEKKEEVRESTKEILSSPGVTTTSSSAYMYTAKVIESNVRYDPFDRNMIAIDNNLAIRPNALRTGPASRQRVQPIDIPETAEFGKRSEKLSSSPDDNDDWFHKHPSIGMSNVLDISPVKSSPSHSPLMFSMSPPKSPWSDKRPLMNIKASKLVEHTESKSIVRIAGLSPLQQRVISLNDEDDDIDTGFKSLTNFPCKEKLSKPVAKAHSFKSAKTNVASDLKVAAAYKSMEEKNFIKSISLDSVTNVNDNEQNVTKPNSIEMFHVADVSISRATTNHKAIVNITTNDVACKEMSVTKVQLNSDDKLSKKLDFSKTKSRFASGDGEAFANVSIKLRNNVMERDSEHNGMSLRKFSNDSIELVKRDDIEEREAKKNDAITGNANAAIVTVTTMTNAGHYRKMNDSKLVIRKKSNSLDSGDSKESTPRSSQSSLDKLETKSQEYIKTSTDSVVRRRSLVKQKDEEPELMKVFARRSLKLKDSEIEALQQQVAKMSEQEERNATASKTAAVIAAFEVNNLSKSRDSDKENLSDSSPVEERRKPVIAPKGPLLEAKVKIDGLDVTLRKPISNMLAAFQNRPATITTSLKNENKILKSNVAAPVRPKTEMKFVSITHEEMKRRESTDVDLTSTIINTAEIISNISEKRELIDDTHVEMQNFRLRKAEWEKRAQESIKKAGL